MALTERNRNVLYQGLTRAVGDREAVEAMLSPFPARDIDEPATKDFVLAVEARLRKDMADGFATMAHQLHAEMRRWFVWSYGALFALLAAVVAVAKILQ